SGALPIWVAPSVNTTVPVGVPAPGATAETVAVNVTGRPKTDGDGLAVTTVAVWALPTCWVTAPDVEPARPEVPPYVAVSEWSPAPSAAVVSTACPGLGPSSAAVPSAWAPSRNVT